jgi:MFS family permease
VWDRRQICYTLIPLDNAWLFLLLEPTHGLVFAGMWIASVELASQLAPPTGQGTMQALIGGLYYVLAVGVIGTNVAGYVITWKGGGEEAWHYLYKSGGVVMVGWSVLWNTMSFMQQRCGSGGGGAGYVRQVEDA